MWCLQGALSAGHGIRHHSRLCSQCIFKLQRTERRAAECQVRKTKKLKNTESPSTITYFFSIYWQIKPRAERRRLVSGLPAGQQELRKGVDSGQLQWALCDHKDSHPGPFWQWHGRRVCGDFLAALHPRRCQLDAVAEQVRRICKSTPANEKRWFTAQQCQLFRLQFRPHASFLAWFNAPTVLLFLHTAHACFSLSLSGQMQQQQQQSYQRPRLPVVADETVRPFFNSPCTHSSPSLWNNLHFSCQVIL